MAIMLKIDNEGLFLLGQALQEEEHMRVSTPYLDLKNGMVVAFDDEELKKLKGKIGLDYVEIPCISHAELHELLDEFVWSLENEDARKAVEEKCGIGETLGTLDEYKGDSSKFSIFVARRWLQSIGIEIAN